LFETRKKLLLIIKVPRKEGGHKRGGALSNPGVLHEPLIHNMIINPHPDSQFVTDEDAMAFRLYQNGENHIYYFLFDWWGGGGGNWHISQIY